MYFINSSIGVNDQVLLNDINYAAISGPSFTPGVGGTYKQPPPAFKPPEKTVPEWEKGEPSPGCEHTLTAGWRTIDYCTDKTETCSLGRPLLPQRLIDPGRLQYACDMQVNEEVLKEERTDDPKNVLVLLAIAFIIYLLYVKFFRL